MRTIYVDSSTKGLIAYVDCAGTSKIVENVHGTNNELEYQAVIYALKQLPETYIAKIYSDSLLVVQQLSHRWAIKDADLRKLAVEAWNLIDSKHLTVSFDWIPRESNLAGKLLG